jgi:hypothetical protein
MTNSLDIIKRHLSPLIPLSLIREDGIEDIIYLKPLNNGQRIQALSLIKKLNLLNEKNSITKDNKIILEEDLNKEMFDLLFSIIKYSISDLDDETIENFVLSNFNDLFDKIGDLFPKPKNEEKLNILKKKLEDRKKIIKEANKNE